MSDHSNVQLVNGLWVALPVEPPSSPRAEWNPDSHRAHFNWERAEPGTMLARLSERLDGNGIDPRFTPDQTLAAISEFLCLFPDAEFGPGHITLSDYNLDSDSIGSCIRRCFQEPDEFDTAEIGHFLASLLALDDDERMHDD